MAAYPNSTYSPDSSVEAVPNIELDISADGTIRGRELRTNEVYNVRLIHEALSETDANTIEDFYEADISRQVEVTWRGVTYNCRWKGKPVVFYFGGVLWQVESNLVGVRSDGL